MCKKVWKSQVQVCLGDITIGAVETMGTREFSKIASHFGAVISCRTAGTHWLTRQVVVGSCRARHWAINPLGAVMTWWAKSSFRTKTKKIH